MISCFLIENMNYDITVIKYDPSCTLIALCSVRFNAKLAHFELNFLRKSLCLSA